MYIDARKNKNGTTTWRITFTDDNGKRKRLSPSEYPKFKSYHEAEAWIKTQEAYQHARRARVALRQEWRSKYYNFGVLEQGFVKWYRKRAPNTWKDANLYMAYIMDFFLTKKQAGNVNLWNLFHQEFRDYLENDAKLTTKGQGSLSYSTANHCIRTLNNFQEYLVAYNLMDPEAKVTCAAFGQHLVGKRSWEDVITPEEFNTVHRQLTTVNPDVADFFYVAYWTGARFSEIRGLPMSYIYGGEVEGPIGDELKKHGIKSYGYIVLESQLGGKVITRQSGKVARKPLKTKKKISPENARTIPIMDKGCWNILARRYKQQDKQLQAALFGTDKDNYLLFDNLSMSILTTTLKSVYKRIGLRPKSYHCCRHSRATYLVGQTRSFFLGKAMLGHKSDTHEDYIHIFEMINLKAKQQSQSIEEIA